MSKGKTLASTLECPADKFNRILDEVDSKLMTYEELRLIRNKVVTTGLSDELYAFLDKNSSMRGLFFGLPQHSGNIANESLREDQMINEVHCIDVAIEGLFADIKAALRRLWNAFWDWVLDWIDDNRRLYFRLQRHKVALENNSFDYGTDEDLTNIKGVVYHYSTEWTVMLNAVNEISKILGKVTSNDVEKFFADNQSSLSEHLSVFGYSMTDAGIIADKPQFSKRERSLGKGGANWVKANMLLGCRTAMDMLKLEEAKRNEFKNIKRAFDKAMSGDSDTVKVAQMAKLLRVCKLCKTFASTTARACADVCRIAKAGASR